MKDRIKKLRRLLELTQKEFAERIGIKRNTIASYETGRNKPIDSVVSLICREYNVSEEWLRNGTGEMFRPEPMNELQSLSKTFNLSEGEQIFLEKYLNLKREERDNVFKFLIDVCSAISSSDSAQDDSVDDIDIDAEVEAYRRQLELQKKQEENYLSPVVATKM